MVPRVGLIEGLVRLLPAGVAAGRAGVEGTGSLVHLVRECL